MSAEQRLAELGIELPPVSPPAASYVNAVRTGNLVYLSGAGPTTPGTAAPTGKVGSDVTTEEAAAHARQVGIKAIFEVE
jgi:enamine deaminase RidA (YjgF/YER057c/UK114 family)